MAGFNPYYVDEIVSQAGTGSNYFGLIEQQEVTRPELHGYEVTMSGRLVLPELNRPAEPQDRPEQAALVC